MPNSLIKAGAAAHVAMVKTGFSHMVATVLAVVSVPKASKAGLMNLLTGGTAVKRWGRSAKLDVRADPADMSSLGCGACSLYCATMAAKGYVKDDEYPARMISTASFVELLSAEKGAATNLPAMSAVNAMFD